MKTNPENVLDFSSPNAAWVNEQVILGVEVDHHIENIKMRGYTILEDCYDKVELECIRNSIDEMYEIQVKEVGGEGTLIEIGEEGIVRQLLAYDETFLERARNKKVLSIVKCLLGENFILYQQNANIHKPGVPHTSGPWHRDLTFFHFTSSRPLAITALHIVDDYTEETGGLFVLRGTHMHEKFPSSEYVNKNKELLTPKAGTIIVFDAMMFHSPQINSSNKVRRSLTHFYTLHLLQQQICLPRLLNGKWSDDSFLRKFLGYDSMQQASPKEWRLEKHRNKRKTLTVY